MTTEPDNLETSETAAAPRPETPPAEAQSAADDPGARLATALAERDANYERFLRSQAELDNFRKRVQRERDEDRRYASLPVVRDLLPVIDNLRRALDAASSAGESGNLRQGIELVLQQLEGVLTRHGAQAIPAVGQPFDPHLHEAVQQVPSAEHPPMTVIQELERGYTLHERVVRPSKVIVSAGSDER
jgi:molecular chaperone GrpE